MIKPRIIYYPGIGRTDGKKRKQNARWTHFEIITEGSMVRPITLTACGREGDMRMYTTKDEKRVTCPRCLESLKPKETI